MNRAVGIDLGGTTVRTGIFDTSSWDLIDQRTVPTRVASGPDAVVADMAESVKILSERHCIQPRSIGLGSPGPLDTQRGKLRSLPNFPGWDGFPLREALSCSTNASVILESDANVAALAEFRLGAGVEYNVDSMLMITLGTGVGSGLVLGGRLWHGRDGMAGELGHAPVVPDGLPCMCGSKGCLERYASATAISEAGQCWAASSIEIDSPTPPLTTRQMAELAQAGHPEMRSIFAQAGHFLGISLASVVNLLDLPLYVVGGGVSEAWHMLAPSLFDSLRQCSNVYRLADHSQDEKFEAGKPFVTRARLGPNAGLIGAAMLTYEIPAEARS